MGCRLSLEVGLDPPNDLHAEPQKGSRHHTRKSALLLHQRGKHLRRLHFHKSSSSSTHRTEEAADPFKKKANYPRLRGQTRDVSGNSLRGLLLRQPLLLLPTISPPRWPTVHPTTTGLTFGLWGVQFWSTCTDHNTSEHTSRKDVSLIAKIKMFNDVGFLQLPMQGHAGRYRAMWGFFFGYCWIFSSIFPTFKKFLPAFCHFLQFLATVRCCRQAKL